MGGGGSISYTIIHYYYWGDLYRGPLGCFEYIDLFFFSKMGWDIFLEIS